MYNYEQTMRDLRHTLYDCLDDMENSALSARYFEEMLEEMLSERPDRYKQFLEEFIYFLGQPKRGEAK